MNEVVVARKFAWFLLTGLLVAGLYLAACFFIPQGTTFILCACGCCLGAGTLIGSGIIVLNCIREQR